MFEFLKRNKTDETPAKPVIVQELAETVKTPEKIQKARFSKRISVEKPSRAEMEMEALKLAVEVAENKDNPDRRLILGIFKQTIKDGHLRSQLRTAHNTIQQSEFKIVNESGQEQKDKSTLFERSWFTDFIKYAIDSEFYGHSLIELALKDEKGFTACTLIPRYHVIPNTGEVVLDYEKDLKINYRANLTALGLIEIGSNDDLGLLEIAAREVIWKLYSRVDWSQHSEKFGMPLLSIETESVDDKELDEIEDMAANFGSNGYVIVNKGDKVEIVQTGTGSGNAHAIYKDKVEMCNAELSKLINGQTMTADNGSSYAQSEVHERILNNYTIARLERLQREVNDKLMPYLIENGYALQNLKFQYLDLEKQEEKQTEPTEQTKTGDEKKKLKLNQDPRSFKNLSYEIEAIYDSFHEGLELAGSFKGIAASLFNKVMERLHKLAKANKLPDNNQIVQEAEELVSETFKKLESGLSEGFKLAGYTPDAVFVNKLKDNLWVFSGLKTYAQLREASNFLIDAKGDLKPWHKFRDDVLGIHKKYNINYLRAEYQHAVGSSQMAAKWKEFEKDGDKFFLQYRTAGDERVRSSHAAMNRVTLPASDPFWDGFFPPNGWGCRCNVVQVLKSQHKATDSKKAMERGEASLIVTDKNGKINEKATKANKIFKFNPGKQAVVFPESHPYFKVPENIKIKLKKGYLKAETIKEAEIIIKQYFDVNEVSLKGLNIEPANDIINSLKMAAQIHKVKINKILTLPGLGDAAQAVFNENTILFDPNYLNDSKGLDNLFSLFGKEYYVKTGLNSVEYLTAHETGHLFFNSGHFAKISNKKQDAIVDLCVGHTELKDGDSGFISERAQSDPFEFFAESFVMDCFSAKKSVYCTKFFKLIK